MDDCVYEKNELADIIEKQRKKFLSKTDHSNGTSGGDGGCGCKKNIKTRIHTMNKSITNLIY